ncbi:MAG TPA: hypothetical protein VIK35_09145 [Verrucomicrobiae bacterium]
MSKQTKSQRGFGEPFSAEPKRWLQPPKWGPWQRTRERLEIIRKNLDKSDAEIGRIFGVTRAAVHALRLRFGIPKKRFHTQRRERFISLVRKMPPGLTLQEVALKLGLLEKSIHYYAHLAGYRLPSRPEIKNRQWNERLQSLPPALTLPMVARQLGVSYHNAYRLCKQFRYKFRDRRYLEPPPQDLINLMRKMQPDLTRQAMALKLKLPKTRAIYYANIAGYRFLSRREIMDHHWNERMKSLPPGLTLPIVARHLGTSYGYASVLCTKFRYAFRHQQNFRLSPREPDGS